MSDHKYRTWGDPFTQLNPIVFFHGLPGIKSGQNQDLAELVHQTTGRQILLPFGIGLSKNPGTFTFTQDIEDKFKTLKQLSHPATLVGHSWGGFQAIALAAHIPTQCKQLILMSPLMGIPDRQPLDAILDQLQADHPQVQFEDRPELLQDADQAREKYSIESLLKKIQAPTTILQAHNDPVTPDQRVKELLHHIKQKPTYRELQCDHNFLENRHLIKQALLEALTD